MANYPNSTGYAWKNIYRLFENIGDRIRNQGSGKVFISFPAIDKNSNYISLDKFDGVCKLKACHLSIISIVRLVRYIVRNKIRYIYLTDQHSTHLIYGIMRFAGVYKIIVHSRVSVASPLPAVEHRFWVLQIKRLLCRLPLLNVQRIYTVSDFVQNRLIFKAGVKKETIITILNGININRFKKIPSNPYPLNDVNIKIFACGRATPEKGFQYLIKSIKLVNSDTKQKSSLYIAGHGPYFKKLKELVLELGIEKDVHLLGEIVDVTAYQMLADINVVPSIWGDACPSSISESLCANRPLICTRAGGIQEMVKSNDGSDVAIIVPPSNAEALAHSIRQIIASPGKYAQLAQAGQQHAMKNLSEDAYYSRFFTCFLKDIE